MLTCITLAVTTVNSTTKLRCQVKGLNKGYCRVLFRVTLVTPAVDGSFTRQAICVAAPFLPVPYYSASASQVRPHR